MYGLIGLFVGCLFGSWVCYKFYYVGGFFVEVCIGVLYDFDIIKWVVFFYYEVNNCCVFYFIFLSYYGIMYMFIDEVYDCVVGVLFV